MFQLGNIGRHSVRVERLAIIKAWLFFLPDHKDPAQTPRPRKPRKTSPCRDCRAPRRQRALVVSIRRSVNVVTTSPSEERSVTRDSSRGLRPLPSARWSRKLLWNRQVRPDLSSCSFVHQPEITYFTVASSENHRWFSCSYVAFIATVSLCNNYIQMVFSSCFFFCLDYLYVVSYRYRETRQNKRFRENCWGTIHFVVQHYIFFDIRINTCACRDIEK